MSLNEADLHNIRTIIREESREIVREELNSAISSRIESRFDKLDGDILALENDIKDICQMITELQKLSRNVARFEKQDLEQKILSSYKEILAIAKKAGVDLPPR